MEFEVDKKPDTGVSDDQRRLAQSRSVTIQPADPFLKPDDAPDPITVKETHSNIDRDSENTAFQESLIMPSKGTTTVPTKRHANRLPVIISSIIIVGGIVVLTFFLTY